MKRKAVVNVSYMEPSDAWFIDISFGSRADSRMASVGTSFNSARAANNAATAIAAYIPGAELRLWRAKK